MTPYPLANTAPAQSPAWRLMVLASLPGLRNHAGDWMLTTKFVEGLKRYAKSWPGPVVVGLQPGQKPTGDLDNRYWSTAELPFEVQLVNFPALAERGSPLLERSIVLVSLNHELYGLADRCREQGAIFVANTELTLTTRLQIARSVQGWSIGFLKTGLWLLMNHLRETREIRRAHGLQCNGTPTFDAFSKHNPSTLLYLDNRVGPDLCATTADIEARFSALSQRKRLRLLFSGRLHPIKGVDHLIPLALRLRERKVDFELRIAGDGPLRASLEAEIARNDLHKQVRLLGTLDFQQELMPMLHRDIDIFVCTHLQGDPSCTYLETMCGGVPIVGYANEAWKGLHRLSSAGRVCELGQSDALAHEIEALSNDHGALRDLAMRALEFSRQHVLETEFENRVDHLKQLCATAEHHA